jgi:hypothetical protein
MALNKIFLKTLCYYEEDKNKLECLSMASFKACQTFESKAGANPSGATLLYMGRQALGLA